MTQVTRPMQPSQIVYETIGYYAINPRSKNVNGYCMYSGLNGAMCAFARCMINPKVAREATPCNGGSQPWSTTRNHDVFLKPQYRGHSITFWRCIQQLHDGESNWTSDMSLSKTGQRLVSDTLRNFPDSEE